MWLQTTGYPAKLWIMAGRFRPVAVGSANAAAHFLGVCTRATGAFGLHVGRWLASA
jgi:hypothetical protein